MTTRPAVTVVATQLIPTMGMERAVFDLLRMLESEGRDVELVVLSGELPNGLTHRARALGLPTGWRRDVAAVRVLRPLIDAAEDRVWIAAGVWSYLPVLLAARRTRARVVAWEHSVLDWRLAHDRGVRARFDLARRLLRDREVVAVSTSVRDCVSARVGSARVTTIANVVRTDGVTPKPPEAGRAGRSARLLGMGSLSAVKSFATAVRATALLDGATLTLLGDGPQREHLGRLANELGISDRVRLPGRVDDVGAHLREADVLIHPSKSETFGFVLVEAALHGVPVVALDKPAMNTVVPTHAPGVLVGSDDPDSFAEGVRAVLSTPPPADAFEDARAAIERDFSEKSILTAWSSLLDAPRGTAGNA